MFVPGVQIATKPRQRGPGKRFVIVIQVKDSCEVNRAEVTLSLCLPERETKDHPSRQRQSVTPVGRRGEQQDGTLTEGTDDL